MVTSRNVYKAFVQLVLMQWTFVHTKSEQKLSLVALRLKYSWRSNWNSFMVSNSSFIDCFVSTEQQNVEIPVWLSAKEEGRVRCVWKSVGGWIKSLRRIPTWLRLQLVSFEDLYCLCFFRTISSSKWNCTDSQGPPRLLIAHGNRNHRRLTCSYWAGQKGLRTMKHSQELRCDSIASCCNESAAEICTTRHHCSVTTC